MPARITLLPEEPVSETDEALYYHGFKLDNIVFACLHYIQFRKHGQIWWGKIHSIWVTKGDKKKMIEVQPFRNVPDEQRRTHYDEYDELYAVVGETIDVPAASVLPYECRLAWVPPHVADDDLIGYVEENIGKPEYKDDTRTLVQPLDDEEEDGVGDFIVHGDRWGFYQYAVNNKTDTVDYSPSPQFTDLAMSITKARVEEDDWHTSELCTYIFNNFVKPANELMHTYDDCLTEERIKGFMDGIRGELLKEQRDLTKMYEMCLGVKYAK